MINLRTLVEYVSDTRHDSAEVVFPYLSFKPAPVLCTASLPKAAQTLLQGIWFGGYHYMINIIQSTLWTEVQGNSCYLLAREVELLSLQLCWKQIEAQFHSY